jgi:hypothetical protein
MVAILQDVAVLSAALGIVPITQEASAAQNTNLNFKQNQKNKCSGSTGCTNTRTIKFGSGHHDPNL